MTVGHARVVELRNLLGAVEVKISRQAKLHPDVKTHVRALDLLAVAEVVVWDLRSSRDHVRARAARKLVNCVRRVFALTDNLPIIDADVALLAGAVVSTFGAAR